MVIKTIFLGQITGEIHLKIYSYDINQQPNEFLMKLIKSKDVSQLEDIYMQRINDLAS